MISSRPSSAIPPNVTPPNSHGLRALTEWKISSPVAVGEFKRSAHMIPAFTFVSILFAAPILARAQNANEPSQEEVAKALAHTISVSTLRHAALDAADRTKIPHLKDFLVLYPDSVVQYLSFAGADFPSLSITTTLHKRYEFSMRIPVIYSKDNQTITGYGHPQCHLLEIESVDRRGAELGGTSGGDLQKHFGEREWKALLDAKGDFSTLGYNLKKNAPVPDFDLVIKNLRSRGRRLPNSALPVAPLQPSARPESKSETGQKPHPNRQ